MAIFSKDSGPHFYGGYFYVIADKNFYCKHFPELTDKEIVDNLKFIHSLGGFMAMTVDVSKMEMVRPDMVESTKKYFKLLQELAGEDFNNSISVLISKDYADLLTQDEYDAIIFHEYAHIENGDLSKPHSDKGPTHVYDVAFEMRADASAASKTTPKAMADALVKLILQKAKLKEGDYEKAKSVDPDVVKRLEALGY